MPRGKLGYLIAANAMAYQGRKLYGHARWAYRTARGMYYGRSRKRVMRRARKYRRRYRKIRQGKRQRFGRSTFGFTPGTSLSRRVQTNVNSNWVLQTRTLERTNCTNCARGTNLNERSADLLYCSGLKINMQVRNTRSEPVMMHVAICAPREYAGAAGSADSKIDFFRSVNGTRGLTFADLLTSNEFNTRGINTDKYHVFFHKRYTLGPEVTAPVGDGGYEPSIQRNWKYIRQWVPIKRQIRYEDTLADSCVNKIFMFVWADLFLDFSGQTPRDFLVGSQKEVILYYRDSREN